MQLWHNRENSLPCTLLFRSNITFGKVEKVWYAEHSEIHSVEDHKDVNCSYLYFLTYNES